MGPTAPHARHLDSTRVSIPLSLGLLPSDCYVESVQPVSLTGGVWCGVRGGWGHLSVLGGRGLLGVSVRGLGVFPFSLWLLSFLDRGGVHLSVDGVVNAVAGSGE